MVVVEELKFPERKAIVGIVTRFVLASWSKTLR